MSKIRADVISKTSFNGSFHFTFCCFGSFGLGLIFPIFLFSVRLYVNVSDNNWEQRNKILKSKVRIN